jgi:hypothetical protein
MKNFLASNFHNKSSICDTPNFKVSCGLLYVCVVGPSFGKPIERNIYFGKLELFAFPQIEGIESKK